MMKQVLLPIFGIVMVLTLAGAGTLASFSDTETSSGNTFETGSLDLKLADTDEWFGDDPLGDSVSATWVLDGAFPGESVTASLVARNFGTIDASRLEMRTVNKCSEPTDDTEPEHVAESAILGYEVPYDAGYGIFDKDKELIVTLMIYDGVIIIWGEENSFNPAYVTDIDGDGQISLDELETQTIILPPPNVGSWSLLMTIKFDEDAGNEYQGDRVDTTFIFALFQ